METKINFITGDVKRSLLLMSLPMIAAMFLNMAYNLVDSLWIGNLLGETAMASLTAATPIILILTSISMGATNGVSILLSQSIGEGNEKKSESLIATSLIASVVFSLALTIIIEISLPYILRLLNTPNETFSMAQSYLSIYLLGYIAVYLYCYFTAVLRSYGNSMFQVIGMVFCTVLNVILDPIFIMFIGFKGAAIATLLSQIIALVIMIAYLYKQRLFKFRISSFDMSMISGIVKKSLPSIVQQSIPAVSNSFLTSVVSVFGVTAIAAYGITGKMETILLYPAMALNMVLTTIIGQCIGGKCYKRAKEYIKYSLLYGSGALIVLSGFIIVFSKGISGLFVGSEAISEIVSVYFLIIGIGYVLNTVTNCFLGAINGMGKPLGGMLLMVFYYIIVRMPIAYLLSTTCLGLKGIWIGVLISHIAASIAASFCGNMFLMKLEKTQC